MIAILLQAALVFLLVLGCLALFLRKEKKPRSHIDPPPTIIDRWPRGKR